MHLREPRCTARRSRAIAVLLALAACASDRPDPAVEAAIGKATGVGDAIVFRSDGGPLDEEALPVTAQLSLASAVRRALATDASLQSALARVRIAIADADGARLLPNPILDLVFRFGEAKPEIEAGLSENIVQLLTRPARAAAADKRLRSAAAGAVTAALDVLAEVQQTYAAVQAADALVPMLNSRLALLQQLVDLARLRADAGEGAEVDVTTLQAQRVVLDVEVAAARIDQRSNRLHLARLLGEPSGNAAWELQPWSPPPSTAVGDETVWLRTALKCRPEVQAAGWALAALGDDRAVASWSPWADTALGASYQRDGASTLGPTLSVPVPLFDSGATARARLTAAQIEARHELTASRRKVVEEVRVAHQTLRGDLANLARVRSELLPLQSTRREQAEFAYRAGQTDLTALLLAESDLRQAEVKAIEIEQQTTVALIQLHRAVGGPGAADPDPAVPDPEQPAAK
jgi:cobalt-zinc-cadmium efflux system outer membrane protein